MNAKFEKLNIGNYNINLEKLKKKENFFVFRDMRNSISLSEEWYNLDASSFIGKFNKDFTIDNLTAVNKGEKEVFSFGDNLIYREEVKNGLKYKSLNSRNTYFSKTRVSLGRLFKDKFVLVESDDEQTISVKTFDNRLQFLSEQVGEYKDIIKVLNDEAIQEEKEYLELCQAIKVLYPKYNLSFLDYHNKYEESGILAVMYDKDAQKEYVANFSIDKQLKWKKDYPKNFLLSECVFFGDKFIYLQNAGKSFKKWKVCALNEDKDFVLFEFNALEPRFIQVNDSIVIGFYDFENYSNLEKEILKDTGLNLGPVGFIKI